jgi:hypothetical protein
MEFATVQVKREEDQFSYSEGSGEQEQEQEPTRKLRVSGSVGR